MDDITSKLASILQDPEGMEQIKTLAGNLLGDSGLDINNIMPDQSKTESNEFSDILNGITPQQLSKVMGIMRAFNSSGDDDRTKLLLALRPHLSAKRKEKLDMAVKLLKLVSIMPALSESGIFKL